MTICPELNWVVSPTTIVRRNIFEMTYDATTITFPAPEFGNRHEEAPREIKRETIHKEWISFKDAEWVGIKTYRYQFDNLSRTVADAYLDFIVESLGWPISVTDHNTITYNALIVEPQASVGYFTDGNECENTAEVILRWLP